MAKVIQAASLFRKPHPTSWQATRLLFVLRPNLKIPESSS